MQTLFDDWTEQDRGPYLQIITGKLNIISIFDELRYDRSDADLLSPAMRMHLVKKLKTFGFKQKSGRILKHSKTQTHCHIPSSHALGASPFHITDSCPKGDKDFYALTPTQTACQFIQHYPVEEALERIKHLIASQPINIYRLSDYLEYEEKYSDFMQAIGHLKYVQRVALESSKLKSFRSLTLSRH